jgi:hypothetical protein
MKSTSVFLAAIAAPFFALAACQSKEPTESKPATPRPVVAPADITKDYTADIEKLCNVIQLSGAPDDDAQTLTTANWLAANLTTAESRKFLVSIQPLVGPAKADALDAEAKRVGLVGCALSALWRKPDAVPPP